MGDLVCAVDAGTGSVRAGLYDRKGALRARATRPIGMSRPAPGWAEQDSEAIWRAAAVAVRTALAEAAASADDVAALGFDATCSLVLRAADGTPLDLGGAGEGGRFDTIAWLDHRAAAEAALCDATGHAVLAYSGGRISPEMQIPKLVWLKRQRPDLWRRLGLAFDLADFLTWRATGAAARSQSTLACKWTYLPQRGGWQRDFLDGVGLGDLVDRAGLPERATPVGGVVGTLSPAAAGELGLAAGIPVASGLIDAYAGALGTIGGHDAAERHEHFALIAGTSSCVMGFSADPRPATAVWGPYLGAALPDLWIAEAGQSASGALLDHLVRAHGTTPDGATHGAIATRIEALRAEAGGDLAAELHVLPDFHGNRTPFADPRPRGVLSGLALDSSFDGLCRLYWRTAVAIALGLRQVVEHLEAQGYSPRHLHAAGGHARSPLLMQLYADALGRPVTRSGGEDAVLLGTASTAAAAAGWHDSVAAACAAMRQDGRSFLPDPRAARAHARDYRILRRMQAHRLEIEAMAADAIVPPPLPERTAP